MTLVRLLKKPTCHLVEVTVAVFHATRNCISYNKINLSRVYIVTLTRINIHIHISFDQNDLKVSELTGVQGFWDQKSLKTYLRCETRVGSSWGGLPYIYIYIHII